MYVKDKMSTDLITVYSNYSVSTALDLMQSNHLHRLPVVDKNNALVGLVTESLVIKNTPNNTSTLSVFEMNYLLNKVKISDIMIKAKDVYTIAEDALLEEAASLMREHDIGCLPVLDGSKVIGIITHNDIFEAFIDMLGYHINGTRYVIAIDKDVPGVLEAIASCFSKLDLSISNLSVLKTPRGIEVVVIEKGYDTDASKALKEAGFNVTSITKLNENDRKQ